MKKAKCNIIIYITSVLLALGLQVSAQSVICYAADDQNESSSYVQSLQLLGQAAKNLVVLMDEAADEVINPLISRKEVYRIKPGKKISRKEIRRRGGSARYFQIYKIKKGDRVYKRIAGRSYNPGGAVKLSDLRYIRTLYYDFKGKIRSGEIIVNRLIAKDTRAVFRELYKTKYQIRKMRLVDDYFPSSKTSSAGTSKTGKSSTGKDKWEPAVWSAAAATAADTESMNDDNTSGFNYRMVAGTSRISMHGYGRAIDVNPFENPWCPGGRIYPNQRASAAYADRANVRDHMIYADSKITEIFKKHGFSWLGETWTRDYQHFEK